MSKSNFHMHTVFCDGLSNPEDYVLTAIEKGMTAIGFSAHVPIPIANYWNMPATKTQDYFDEILRLKQRYVDKIEIYAGFEMDYLITADKNLIQQYIKQADYTIGSIHYLYDEKNQKYYAADGSAADLDITYQEFAGSDDQVLVRSYYQELIRIIHEFKPDIIGHFDIIKKQNHQNRYFNEHDPWYVNLVHQVLDEIAKTGIIIEVNTGGRLRGYITENYPSDWILQICQSKKIPIIISSDAHKPQDIDGFFEETAQKLKDLGFTQQKTLHHGKWIDIDL